MLRLFSVLNKEILTIGGTSNDVKMRMYSVNDPVSNATYIGQCNSSLYIVTPCNISPYVGIGTVLPQTTLHVAGNSLITGSIQSLDSIRTHSLPTDAMIFASGSLINPLSQNLGSYIINDQVSASTPTLNGNVPSTVLSPFADLYKEGSVYIDGGASDYISTSLTGYTMSQGISMEMFVNYANFTNSTYTIGFMAASAATYNFTLGVNSSGYPIVTWTSGTLVSSSVITLNTWYHLATAWNGTTLQLFVNGVYNNGTNSFTPPTLAQNFLIGRANSLACTAYITNVRIVTNPAIYYSSGAFGSYTFTVPSTPLTLASSGTTNFNLRIGQNYPTIQSGAYTFDRALKQYFDFGPQTFNIVTQGFTAIWRGQFTSIAGSYERIFEFGTVNNSTGAAISLMRNAVSNYITAYIYSTTSATPVIALTTSTVLAQNTTYVIALRYSPITQIADIWINGSFNNSVSCLTTALIADRSVPFTYVGRPTDNAAYCSMTMNTIAIYNRALTNTELYNSYIALATTSTSPLQKTIEFGDANGTPALSVASDGKVSVQTIGLTSGVLPWPPAAMTGYDTVINGAVYKARASSEQTGYPSWQLFDNNASTNWAWDYVTKGILYPGGAGITYGYYTGSVVTQDIQGSIYKGEWVQLQLPYSIILSSYTITGLSPTYSPGTFWILGSVDGINWLLVNSQINVVWTGTPQTITFTVTTTQPFSYYRMVIGAIMSSGTGNYSIPFPSWVLYGTVDTSPALTITPPTTFANSVTTPQLIAPSAPSLYVPQDFSVSGLNIPAYIVSNIGSSNFGPFAGEGSLYFPSGNTGRISFGVQPQFAYNWTNYDFTMECFVYHTSRPSDQRLLSRDNDILMYVSGSGNQLILYSAGITTPTGGSFVGGTVSLNQWNHLAVSYIASTSTVYLAVNGSVTSVVKTAGTFQYTGTNNTNIDYWFSGAGTNIGYLASYRFIRGLALYTTNFTVPTTPLQPIQGVTQSGTPYGTILLLRNAPVSGRIQTQKLIGTAGINTIGSVVTTPGVAGTLAFPPSAMTSYTTALSSGYGQGTYVITASSEYSSVYPAWTAFDKSTSLSAIYGGGTIYSYWSGASLYSISGGTYLGSITTIDTVGNPYSGDWLQIQMPISIVLSNYILYERSDYTWQAPTKFWIVGSRDGINWSLVDQRSGVTWSSPYVQTFTVNAVQAYNFYRIIINITTNGGGPGNTPATILEWSLNGTIEGLNINSDGKVGIGVVAPKQNLEVVGTSLFNGNVGIGTTPLSYTLQVQGNLGTSGDITGLYSDERLKTKLEPLSNALQKVTALNGFTYMNNNLAKSYGFTDSLIRVGVSAQEVQRVLPEAVRPAPFDANNASGSNYLTVQYEKIVPLLIEAIKEERAARIALEEKVATFLK